MDELGGEESVGLVGAAPPGAESCEGGAELAESFYRNMGTGKSKEEVQSRVLPIAPATATTTVRVRGAGMSRNGTRKSM